MTPIYDDGVSKQIFPNSELTASLSKNVLSLGVVLDAADELIGFADLDTLYRRSVEFARERLGVVRAGLFVRSGADANLYQGTWGTDLAGRTTDEHQAWGNWPTLELERMRKTVRRLSSRSWESRPSFPISWHLPDGTQMKAGTAWNCVHCLSTGEQVIGVMFVDPGDSGQPLDESHMDLVATYCALLARIIDQRQTHEALRKAEAQRFESLGVLAGGIAHDFNNLLASVLGRLALVLDASPSLAITDRRHLEAARESCCRGTALTGRLLTFARGGAPLRKSVDASKLLQKVVSEAAEIHALRLHLEIEDGLPLIWAEEAQLAQALQNLVINCCQWLPKGYLEISLRRVRLIDHEQLEIRFEDDGPGIPESLRSRVFEPYFTTRSNSSGLGLATCRSIINRHGGSISCENSRFGGAGFRILLPVAAVAPEPESESEVATQPRLASHILVMDDEPEIRETISALLQILGAEVATFKDGAEAVEGWVRAMREGRPFDLGIMDLTVPDGMGGLDASRTILGHDPGARLVVCSGYSNDPVLSDPKAAGFVASLAKPFCRQDLAKVVGVALGGRIPARDGGASILVH